MISMKHNEYNRNWQGRAIWREKEYNTLKIQARVSSPPHGAVGCPTCSGWPHCYDHSFSMKDEAPDSCLQMQLEGTIQAGDSQC